MTADLLAEFLWLWAVTALRIAVTAWPGVMVGVWWVWDWEKRRTLTTECRTTSGALEWFTKTFPCWEYLCPGG